MRRLLLILAIAIVISLVIYAFMANTPIQAQGEVVCPEFGYEATLSPILSYGSFVSTGVAGPDGCEVIFIHENNGPVWLGVDLVRTFQLYSQVVNRDFKVDLAYVIVYEQNGGPLVIQSITPLVEPVEVLLEPSILVYPQTRWLETNFPGWDLLTMAVIYQDDYQSPVMFLPIGEHGAAALLVKDSTN